MHAGEKYRQTKSLTRLKPTFNSGFTDSSSRPPLKWVKIFIYFQKWRQRKRERRRLISIINLILLDNTKFKTICLPTHSSPSLLFSAVIATERPSFFCLYSCYYFVWQKMPQFPKTLQRILLNRVCPHNTSLQVRSEGENLITSETFLISHRLWKSKLKKSQVEWKLKESQSWKQCRVTEKKSICKKSTFQNWHLNTAVMSASLWTKFWTQ